MQSAQNFPLGGFGAHGALGAFGAHGLLRAPHCWPEDPRGGGKGSWRPRTRGVAPPPPPPGLAPIFFGRLDGVVVEVSPKKLLGMALRMHKLQRDAKGGRPGWFISTYRASLSTSLTTRFRGPRASQSEHGMLSLYKYKRSQLG